MGKLQIVKIAAAYIVKNHDDSITIILTQPTCEVQITINDAGGLRPEHGEYGVTVDVHSELLKLIEKGQ